MEETATQTEKTPQTLEQLQAELSEWLQKNRLRPVVLARGLRSGQVSPIIDFLPPTHEAVFVLEQAP